MTGFDPSAAMFSRSSILSSAASEVGLLSFVDLFPISERNFDFSGAGGGMLGKLGSGRSCVGAGAGAGAGGCDDFTGGVGANGMVAVEPLLTVSLREGGRELRESERD